MQALDTLFTIALVFFLFTFGTFVTILTGLLLPTALGEMKEFFKGKQNDRDK